MSDYRQLKAWQRAYSLALDLYRVTRDFPSHERYGLTSQLRRAATSVVANVAEGAGRGAEGDFTRFLWIARGSLTELVAEITLGRDLGYLKPEDAERLLERGNEVGRMLTGLLKSRGAIPIRNRPSNS
jgi:four helix bundle protein